MKFGEGGFGAFRGDDSVSLFVHPSGENREIAPVRLDKKHARTSLFAANSFDLRVKRHRGASKRKWLTRR